MITFEHIGGVGINARFIIHKDGAPVAMMSRCGNRGWEISSKHYGLTLAKNIRVIDKAKETASTINYPNEVEVYERICVGTAGRRQKYIEEKNAHELARIARGILSGSNSAQYELKKLMDEIERFIVDRTDTRANAQAECDRHFEETGESTYTNASYYPYYPDPPQKGR